MSTPTHELNDGKHLPAVGFGTHPLKGEDAVVAMTSALEVGYRLLDTAVNYENEHDVGEALRRSGLPREEVQIASKVPGRDHAHDKAVASVEGSLRALRVDYLDYALIHWPNPGVGLYVEAWQALIDVRERGLVRSIGVCNFTEHHLQRIIDATGVTPAVNQIEVHPYFPQVPMREANARLGIRTEAWSPLGKNPTPFDEPAVKAAAAAHGVTPAQAVLRWHVQQGTVPLPKSATPSRQRENLDVFGFALTDAQIAAITALGREDGRRFSGDPDTHEEM